MKIFYLANIRFPTEKAHGLQIAKMCEGFGFKNKVVLVVPWRFNPIKKNPFEYYNLKKNFKIVKLFSLDLVVLGLPKIGFIIQSITFYIFVFFYLFLNQPDIIYTRDWRLAYFLSFASKNVFLELHSLPCRLNKYQSKRIRGIITITRIIKKKLVKKELNKREILAISDGVDIKQFDIKISPKRARKKLSLPLDKKIIGYVGQLKTLGMEKGINQLFNAVKILKKNNLSLILCLVGGLKKDIVQYQKLASNMNLEENILFVGQVNHCFIPYYLKSFDALTMPFPQTEHYACYMSPLKMFEYMASRRPIIASDLPAVREVLNKRNSLLIKPDNFQDLSRGIRFILENVDFSNKISRRALQDVQQRTWLKRSEIIVRFIKKRLIH